MKFGEYRVMGDHAYILPISDIHIGDKAFNEESRKKLTDNIEWVRKEPLARVFLCGDILNTATRTSKTSPFQQNLTLQEQIEEAIKIFLPIKDKIVGVISGNHEQRMEDICGGNPLMHFCYALGVQYYGYSAVIKFVVGSGKHSGRGSSVAYLAYLHHCFDENTEVLTKDGWKTHDKIKKDDVVMTMNLDSKAMEWNNINGIFKYGDYKNMYSFSGKTYDFCVTGDHDIVTVSRYTGRQCKEKARSLLKRGFNIPCAGKNKNEEYPISDNLLKLLCWVITEGTKFDKRRRHEVRITQNKSSIERLEKIISGLSKEFEIKTNKRLKYKKGVYGNINRNDDSYEIYINKCGLSSKIKELIPDKKIPVFFFELSKRQFDIALSELVYCDGHTDTRTGCVNLSYSQRDVKELDKLQALCAINGYRSVLNKTSDGKRVPVLNIMEKQTTRVRSDKSKEVKYDGIAWCLAVDNKTLLIRRNGRVAITGNTTGGGGTPGGKMNRVDKLRNIVCNADLYIGAHNHQLGVIPVTTRMYENAHNRVVVLRQTLVDSGSYLSWNDSYAEAKQMTPAKMGSPRIRLDGKRKDIHVSV